MRILERKDILELLQSEVEKAGGQSAWAKRHRVERTNLNKALRGVISPPESIIRALGLRIVVVSDRG